MLAVALDNDLLLLADCNSLESEFSGLSDLLARVGEDEIEARKSPAVWEAEILTDYSLMDYLFSEFGRQYDCDLKNLLIRQIDALVEWGGDELSVQTVRELIVERLGRGEAFASLGLPCNCSDGHAVDCGGAQVHLVGDTGQLIDFYIAAPELADLNAEQVIQVCTIAFRNLYFREGIHRDFSHFNESYRAIRPKVLSGLRALNDHLRILRKECEDNPNEFQQKFKAAHRFDISPESSSTHRAPKAMRERKVEFDGKEYVCEWHLKIRPHIDRIHFNFEDFTSKILIGKFVSHLST